MNVLSLFDGMSCCQQALERAGHKVTTYYASEVDKYAIQVTQANYPNTIQLGDVRNVNGYELGHIDVLAGGSPCQSFSFAGKRKGMSTKCEIEIYTLDKYLELKSQNFEFEGQSYLFWEYMRILNELRTINPNIKYLLENVLMGEKWQKILTKAIGINPIMINSALVSAQNRKRLYWTNIGAESDGLFGDLVCKIPQPKDKGILLKDILENEVDAKYYLSDRMLKNMKQWNDTGNGIIGHSGSGGQKGSIYSDKNKIGSLCATDYKQAKQIIAHNTMPRSSKTGKGGTGPLSRTDGKTYCLDTGTTNAVEIVAMRGRGIDNIQTLESNGTGKTNCLTSVQKDNLVMQLNQSKESGGKQPYQQNRVYDIEGISPALCAFKSDLIISGTLRTHKDGNGFREVVSGKGATIPARAREDGSGQNVVSVQGNIRRLTPRECERLQTVADGYTAHVSDTQRYKMLGNGWTVDVIAHIFKYL